MKIEDDRGSALIDFLGYGVLLQIPVLVLAIQLSSLQTSQLAADSVARHSLRSFVLQGVEVEVTAREVAEDFGLKVKPLVTLACEPDCTSAGSILRIGVSIGDIKSSSVMIR